MRHKCPCGKASEGRTRAVGDCEVYKEQRDVLQEKMGKIDARDMEKFRTLDDSGKTIAVRYSIPVGDR